MFKATKDILLPTTVTGSLPRPSWFCCNLHGRAFTTAMSDVTFREQYGDAVSVQIADQERAGLDILVDGDSRFDMDIGGHSWFAYVSDRLAGMAPGRLEPQPLVSNRDKRPGDILFEVMETRLPASVTAKVGAGQLDYDAVWKVAQRYTDRPVKLGAISAQLLETLVNNRHYERRRDLVNDLSDLLNVEYHKVADAGCELIQIEEPSIHQTLGIETDEGLTPDFLVDAFNREVAGLRDKTEVWCHTCWGNPSAQRVETNRQSYRESLPYLDRLDVDVLTFEAADSGGSDLEAIGRMIGPEKKIAIGVVSHRSLQVERPEEVAALVRKAMQYIAPERLILTSDCGFGRQGMSRIHAFYKMVSIAQGANIIRRERGWPETPIPAADPRFALLQQA
jgi:5-methyltetrahydropteroyltriglutamate--homocysteine methyltransferase